MLLPLLTLLALNLGPSSVLCGQVPVVGGLVGGVPQRSQTYTSPSRLVASNVTAGKLRFVENSGICGMTSALLGSFTDVLTFRLCQKQLPMFIKLQDMGI